MRKGRYWIGIALGLIALMALYFAFNSSYERSVQARFYYTIGDYRHAYAFAKEAFDMDPYNRMAVTVMTQSQTALKFVDYIEQAKAYSMDIARIANGDSSVNRADKIRMKLMCEVMMARYIKISPIERDGRKGVIDAELLEEASTYYNQFVELHEKIVDTL